MLPGLAALFDFVVKYDSQDTQTTDNFGLLMFPQLELYMIL